MSKTPEEVRRRLEADPRVASGQMTPEIAELRRRLAERRQVRPHRAQDQPGFPSTGERVVAEFGRGMADELTLGAYPGSRDQVLDLNPGRLDITDFAAGLGRLVGAAPWALATGGLAQFGARAGAGRLAARAAAREGAEGAAAAAARRALAYVSTRPPAEASRLARAVQTGSSNLYDGLAFSLATAPLRRLEEGESRARQMALEVGVGAAADFLLGAMLPVLGVTTRGLTRRLRNSDNHIDREIADAIEERLLSPAQTAPESRMLPGAGQTSRQPVRPMGGAGWSTVRPDEVRPAGPVTTPERRLLTSGVEPERFVPDTPERLEPSFVAGPEGARAIIPPARRLEARTTNSPLVTPAPEGSTVPARLVDRIGPDPVPQRILPAPEPEAPTPAAPRAEGPRNAAERMTAPETPETPAERMTAPEPAAPAPDAPEAPVRLLEPERYRALSRQGREIADAIEMAADVGELATHAANLTTHRNTADREILADLVQRKFAELGRGEAPGRPARPSEPPARTAPGETAPRATYGGTPERGTPERGTPERSRTARRMREMRRQLREAEQNPVTRLPNRSVFERALQRVERDPEGVVGVVDIANFKAVNELRSYAEGDEYLRRTADALREAAREVAGSDRGVFHFGGDEFAVIGRGDQAQRILRRAAEILGTERVGDFDVRLRHATGDDFQGAMRALEQVGAGETGPRYRPMSPEAAPSARPERVEQAAVRIGDEIFEGPTHADAMHEAAVAKGLAGPSDDADTVFERALDAFGDTAENGFVTSSGRFVSRTEALDLARSAKQPLTGDAGTHSGGGLFAEDMLPEPLAPGQTPAQPRSAPEPAPREAPREAPRKAASEAASEAPAAEVPERVRRTVERAGDAEPTSARVPEPDTPPGRLPDPDPGPSSFETQAVRFKAEAEAMARDFERTRPGARTEVFQNEHGQWQVRVHLGADAPGPRTPAPEPQREAGPRAPMREPMRGVDGGETTVVFPDGQRLPARYRVVEARDLIPSHRHDNFAPRPDAPAEIQGRQYHLDEAAQAEVLMHRSAYDPQRAVSLAEEVGAGPPTVRPDGVVIAGNQRTMAEQGLAPARIAAKKERLAAEAERLGIDAARVAEMENPVLVRELVGDGVDLEDRAVLRELNRLSDQPIGKGFDPVSEATSRARRLRDDPQALEHLRQTLGEEQTLRDYLRSADGRRFVDALQETGVISRREIAELRDVQTGALTEKGLDAVERMLQMAAIGDPDLTSAARANLAGLLRNMEHAFPAIVSASTVPGWDLSRTIQGALRLHLELRGTDPSLQIKTLRELIEAPSLLGRQDDPMAVKIAYFLESEKKADIKVAFHQYAKEARLAASEIDQHMMFGMEPKTAEEALDEIFGAAARRAQSKRKPC